METRHIAPHARTEGGADPIFFYGGKAKAAIREHGAEKVINGTIGALLDDSGNLALLEAVEEATHRLATVEVAPYAPVAGLPDFRQDVIDYIYQGVDRRPPALGSVATAGGTGALRLAAWNFLSPGDCLVTHDYFWGPYRTICEDTGRRFVTFPTFLPSGAFNIDGVLATVSSALADRERVLLLLNTPCHNPTGGAITTDEIRALHAGLSSIAAANPEKTLVFLVDAAYWEFGTEEDNRALLSQFTEVPGNMLFCFAFTMSKSFTRYGFRTGALLFAAKSPGVIEAINSTLTRSIRVHWSNTCRLGQRIFSTVFRDPVLLDSLKAEQNAFARLCNERGNLFAREADQVGLTRTPYRGGFFVTLPVGDPSRVVDRLTEDNIFLVPLAKGVRVAVCSIASKHIPGWAARIKAGFP